MIPETTLTIANFDEISQRSDQGIVNYFKWYCSQQKRGPFTKDVSANAYRVTRIAEAVSIDLLLNGEVQARFTIRGARFS